MWFPSAVIFTQKKKMNFFLPYVTWVVMMEYVIWYSTLLRFNAWDFLDIVFKNVHIFKVNATFFLDFYHTVNLQTDS